MTAGERILQLKAYHQKRHPFYFFKLNSVKNQPIFIIISIHISEDISNYRFVIFPVLPE